MPGLLCFHIIGLVHTYCIILYTVYTCCLGLGVPSARCLPPALCRFQPAARSRCPQTAPANSSSSPSAGSEASQKTPLRSTPTSIRAAIPSAALPRQHRTARQRELPQVRRRPQSICLCDTCSPHRRRRRLALSRPLPAPTTYQPIRCSRPVPLPQAFPPTRLQPSKPPQRRSQALCRLPQKISRCSPACRPLPSWVGSNRACNLHSIQKQHSSA